MYRLCVLTKATRTRTAVRGAYVQTGSTEINARHWRPQKTVRYHRTVFFIIYALYLHHQDCPTCDTYIWLSSWYIAIYHTYIFHSSSAKLLLEIDVMLVALVVITRSITLETITHFNKCICYFEYM